MGWEIFIFILRCFPILIVFMNLFWSSTYCFKICFKKNKAEKETYWQLEKSIITCPCLHIKEWINETNTSTESSKLLLKENAGGISIVFGFLFFPTKVSSRKRKDLSRCGFKQEGSIRLSNFINKRCLRLRLNRYSFNSIRLCLFFIINIFTNTNRIPSSTHNPLL